VSSGLDGPWVWSPLTQALVLGAHVLIVCPSQGVGVPVVSYCCPSRAGPPVFIHATHASITGDTLFYTYYF